MDNWDAFNAVYTKYFKPDHYPVRMSFGASSLRGPAVEVQCEAHLGK
jgi:enamine deaminase RidA (YjgF/YER057c/UK114 family)